MVIKGGVMVAVRMVEEVMVELMGEGVVDSLIFSVR